MLSAGTKKRIARIRRRATREVIDAYEQGHISARRADQLLYLPEQEQREEIAHILAVQNNAAQRSRVAARVIKSYVERGCRDLVALRGDLKSALASLTVKTHA